MAHRCLMVLNVNPSHSQQLAHKRRPLPVVCLGQVVVMETAQHFRPPEQSIIPQPPMVTELYPIFLPKLLVLQCERQGRWDQSTSLFSLHPHQEMRTQRINIPESTGTEAESPKDLDPHWTCLPVSKNSVSLSSGRRASKLEILCSMPLG